MSGRKLTMGVILPHTRLFGGVKRFFELAKVFRRHGHRFIVFTSEGISPQWFSDPCKVEKTEKLQDYHLDALFITEPVFLEPLLEANSRLKIFYHVGPRASLVSVLKHKEVIIFVNSTNMYELDKRRYGIRAVRALGGIHVPEIAKRHDSTDSPFTVMAYGRLTRKGKGTALVVKACEKLHALGYNIRLLLFDSPVDELSRQKIKDFSCSVPFDFVVDHPVAENNALFERADVFVAAEKKGGWSNTAAEALAAGVPLVGTSVGTKDFLIHNETGLLVWRHPYFIRKAIQKLIDDPKLRQRLAVNGRKKIAEYDWNNLGCFIESYVLSKEPSPRAFRTRVPAA